MCGAFNSAISFVFIEFYILACAGTLLFPFKNCFVLTLLYTVTIMISKELENVKPSASFWLLHVGNFISG